jgi:hypothetical protein
MGASGGGRMRWGHPLLAAITAVSWSFVAMAGVAALGLHLVGADAAGALGPMTAAAVVLAVGGSVTPSVDFQTFGITGAETHTAVDIAPLGVGLTGALLLSWFFLRSLRSAGTAIGLPELAVRAGLVAVLFLLLLAGLAWVGNDTVTISGAAWPDQLAEARAVIGFRVDAGRSLAGGAGWVTAVLLIALLASRRTPLPPGWDAVHRRTVRPAVSALCSVLVLACGAGLLAGLYAAIGNDHPRLVIGAALLGAPNGVWLGVPLGMFVPWHGAATGVLVRVLPDPVDRLLTGQGGRGEQSVTVGRLAELDGRGWLLVVASVLMMLAAGVLTASRTPAGAADRMAGFAGRCALRLGAVTALALPLLVWLTRVSAGARVSVLGFDALGAGLDLHGAPGPALLLGAAWGAAAGAAGALAARATGVAGRRAPPLADPRRRD